MNEFFDGFNQLCELQTKLKEEHIFRNLQKKKINDVNQELESQISQIICDSKKLLNLHNYSLSVQYKTAHKHKEFVSGLFQETKPDYRSLTNPQIKCFIEIFTNIFGNLNKFAHLISDYSILNKHLLDDITFSLIPGLFGCLWNESSVSKYVSFIVEMIKIHAKQAAVFARPLFIIPYFTKFLKSILDKCNYQANSIQHNYDAEQFVSVFLCIFTQLKNSCPPYFPYILSKIKSRNDQREFLMKSFIEEMCQHPNHYRITTNKIISPEFTQMLLNSFSEQIDTIIDLLDINIYTKSGFNSMTSSTGNLLFSDFIDSDIAFTPKDLYMLKDIINYGKLKNYFHINTSRIDDIIFEDKYKVLFPQYKLSVIQKQNQQNNQTNPSIQSNITDESNLILINNALQSLEEALIMLELLPKNAKQYYQEDTLIFDLLDAQKSKTCRTQRLGIEMKVDSIKEYYSDYFQNMTVLEATKKLTERFDSRKEERLNLLKDISITQHKFNMLNVLYQNIHNNLNTKIDLLAFSYVSEWVLNKRLIFYLNEQTIQEFCTNSSSFQTFFFEWNKNCGNWCSEVGINYDLRDIILHDIIMSKIPLSLFVSYQTKFSNESELLHKFYEKRDSFINFCKKEAVQTLLDHPELFDKAKKQLEHVETITTPYQKCLAITDALNTFLNICFCEAACDSEDDNTPLRLFFFSLCKKMQHLFSTASYITHFTRLCSEKSILPTLDENQNATHYITGCNHIMEELEQNSGI